MKLISFLNQGTPSYGIVNGENVLDLTPILGAHAPDLKALLTQGLQGAAAEAAKSHPFTLQYSQLTLLPVIPNPGQIFCIGLNYGEHVRETGREITETPVIFLRLPESQVAHGQDIVRPPESHRLDYEAEIAIIIGKPGRRIKKEDAWDHIAGYACYNDGSVRDWQVATSQWTPGKNFYRTGGFGPWMVTSDEIPAGKVMRLQTVLNGQVLQDTTTDKMIHDIPSQIAYISTFTPLSPGDVIVTGTPGGVGNKRTPQIFLKPGDVCEIVVDAIGTLRNGIRDE
ncbi:fumarylacetoacetate hydrolase family protein [Acidovorax sp. M2(2025)]|uniref:fumarylacetoacetate hydrolase family protein n=1 Tax=Acidovorax sp. M2(2025) TaxID=3411355 RepID=UPI003BF55877